MSKSFEALVPLDDSHSERGRAAMQAIPATVLRPGQEQPRSLPLENSPNRYAPGQRSLPPGTDSASLDEILAQLGRSKLILVAGGIIGCVAMLAVAGFSTPTYRARTAIRLENPNERFPNLPDMLSETGNSDDMYLQNELKTLESDSLANRVALRLGIEPAQETGSLLSHTPLRNVPVPLATIHRPLSEDDLRIDAVQKVLIIRPSLKSQVVEILFDSPDPVMAAKGANTVVSEYIAMNREARLQAGHDTNEWLAEQITDLKTRLDKGNQELQTFARSAGLLYASNQSLLSEDRTRQVQEALSKAHADRVAKESLYAAAISNSPEALPASADSGLLRDYEAKLAAVQTELTQDRALYTPSHYKVVDAEARAAQLQGLIKQERQRIISRMAAEYDAAQRLESSLSNTYQAQSHELASQTADEFRYNVLKRDLDSTEQIYNSLIQKSKEASVTSAMRTTSVRIVDPARPPVLPYSPNYPLNAAIGFSGGLLFMTGFVLVHKRDVYRSEQTARAQQVEVFELGTIPLAKQDWSRRWPNSGLFRGSPEWRVELATWHEQQSVVTEAFRATLASILFSPIIDQQKSVVLTVTSVQPQEGKTTAVSNLGIALAETHGRTLIIDADLRKPRIHDIFGHCNDKGLTTILTGDEPVAGMDFNSILRETGVPGLFTIPSGPGAPSVAPLLHSARMSALLDRARKEFDYVLIDTPPASLFSDARILGRNSDGVIVVIHSAKVNRSELNSAFLQFMTDGTQLIGTIVNRSAYLKRGYDNYRQEKA